MIHIRNSKPDSIFLLEHEGVPTTLLTDFNEPIVDGSLCIDINNQDIYILKNSIWTLIVGSTSGVSGYIPFYSQNYTSVYAKGSGVENGSNFITALIDAKNLTPNGLPLSNTNRATLYLFNGLYDLDTNNISLGEYVDIVGIGEAEDIKITSSNLAGTIKIDNNNDYILSNLTISNTGGGGSITHNSSQIDNGIWKNLILNAPNTDMTTFNGDYSLLKCSVGQILNGNISGKVRDCIFFNQSCGVSFTSSITISGEVKNCIATDTIFGGNFGLSFAGDVIISGVIDNCHSSAGACFGWAQNDCVLTNTGKILNSSVNGNSSFCYGGGALSNVTIDGIIDNCTSTGQLCFGALNTSVGTCTINGTIKNCTGNEYSFGAVFVDGNATIAIGSITFSSSSIIDNCTGNDFCFGFSGGTGSLFMNGKIINCKGKNYCFGAVYKSTNTAVSDPTGSIFITGIIDNCKSVSFSFGYSLHDTQMNLIGGGTIMNCVANINSFMCNDFASVTGNVLGTNNGKIENCSGNAKCFIHTDRMNINIGTNTLIKNCISKGGSCLGYSSYGNVSLSGTIDNCVGDFGLLVALRGSVVLDINGEITNCDIVNGGGICVTLIGSNNVTISGLIDNCKTKGNGFGYAISGVVTIDGIIKNSECGYLNSGQIGFGFANSVSNVIISGLIENCKTEGGYLSTNANGVLRNCKRITSPTTELHLGTLESCKFIDNSLGNTLTIGSGAKVVNCVIKQLGGGNAIAATSPISASIYYTATNKVNFNISNSISTPYNIVDINI